MLAGLLLVGWHIKILPRLFDEMRDLGIPTQAE
jgi:hypothetical protein